MTDRPKHRDVSAAFERSRRQREADHAGRPDRIADLGRGLAALIPRGPSFPPMPPIYGEGIIPPRFPIPAKVTSFEISPELFAPTPLDVAIAEAMEKLRLEDERMRRILPSLPAGYSWRGEIESRQHIDFARDAGELTMRLVYRIHDRDGERMDGATAAMLWARETPAE